MLWCFTVEDKWSATWDVGDGADAGILAAVFERLWGWWWQLSMQDRQIEKFWTSSLYFAVLSVLVLASDYVWMAAFTNSILAETSPEEAYRTWVHNKTPFIAQCRVSRGDVFTFTAWKWVLRNYEQAMSPVSQILLLQFYCHNSVTGFLQVMKPQVAKMHFWPNLSWRFHWNVVQVCKRTMFPVPASWSKLKPEVEIYRQWLGDPVFFKISVISDLSEHRAENI